VTGFDFQEGKRKLTGTLKNPKKTLDRLPKVWYNKNTKLKGDKKMTIIRNDKNHFDFGNLENGDVFRYQDSIFMVIREVETENGGIYNAIDLENGELTRFYADEEVVAVKAELVVS